jgi:hypothetical protein
VQIQGGVCWAADSGCLCGGAGEWGALGWRRRGVSAIQESRFIEIKAGPSSRKADLRREREMIHACAGSCRTGNV